MQYRWRRTLTLAAILGVLTMALVSNCGISDVYNAAGSFGVPIPPEAQQVYQTYKKVDETYDEIKKWYDIVAPLVQSDDELETYIRDQGVSYCQSHYSLHESNQLTEIGNNVAENSERPDAELPGSLRYEFYVSNESGLNAYTVGGGAVFVTRQLYEAMDEDEMAYVLGHEVGHINRKDVIKMVRNSSQFQVLQELVFRGVGAIKTTGEVKLALAQLVSFTVQAVQAGYSRDCERVADRLGVRFSHKAGYDCHGAIRAVDYFQSATGPGSNCILCDHPSWPERRNIIQQEIDGLE